MLNFFYTLFVALFTGYWNDRVDIFSDLKSPFQDFLTWVGSFFSDTTTGYALTFEDTTYLLAGILSVVVVVGLGFFVVKAIKHIFTIFFEGLR